MQLTSSLSPKKKKIVAHVASEVEDWCRKKRKRYSKYYRKKRHLKKEEENRTKTEEGRRKVLVRLREMLSTYPVISLEITKCCCKNRYYDNRKGYLRCVACSTCA